MPQANFRKTVDELVDTFKREGKFDRLRKNTLEKIFANESFAAIADETDMITDQMLGSLPDYSTKEKARGLLRDQISSFRQKIESAVFQVMGTDENISLILEEVTIPIISFLGLEKVETGECLDEPVTEEDHQVCDMEIESESDTEFCGRRETANSASGVLGGSSGEPSVTRSKPLKKLARPLPHEEPGGFGCESITSAASIATELRKKKPSSVSPTLRATTGFTSKRRKRPNDDGKL